MATTSGRPRCGATSPWSSGCRRTTRCGRCGRWWTRLRGAVAAVRAALRAGGPAVDRPGAAAAGAAAAGALQRAQRAAADGAARLQPALPLVRGPGAQTTRSGMPRCSRRTASGCWRATSPGRSSSGWWRRRGRRGVLSDEHFTVDGTLIEAWASHKSFKREGRPRRPRRMTPESDGELPRRAPQQRHACLDDGPRGAAVPQGRRQGGEAVLPGACADGEPQRPGGRRQPDAGHRHRGAGPGLRWRRGGPRAAGVTLGGDKGYDTRDFVDALRGLAVTPHVAQNTTNRAQRGRSPHHAPRRLQVSQRRRKRIEEIFGWMKTVGCSARRGTAAWRASAGCLPLAWRSTTWSASAPSRRSRHDDAATTGRLACPRGGAPGPNPQRPRGPHDDSREPSHAPFT